MGSFEFLAVIGDKFGIDGISELLFGHIQEGEDRFADKLVGQRGLVFAHLEEGG